MLRRIRIILASVMLIGITLLFLDFTGSIHAYLGWMARVQFLPALMALNVGIILLLIALTIVFGRIYCSVICPLGIMQDCFAWFGRKVKKNRYNYSPAKTWLRYTVLAVFILSFAIGLGSMVALLAPYSAFGRIVSNLLAPIWMWGNNVLAGMAERANSYSFYSVDIWVKSMSTVVIALVTLIVLAVLAWSNGRTYCNTICPVGTLLGLISRYSIMRPVIDVSKCINCGKCARNCKAACIDAKNHTIDYSRCVTCMDCLDNCSTNAISYTALRHKSSVTKDAATSDTGRRNFLSLSLIGGASALMNAKKKKVDGGLAIIQDKKIPARTTRIVPPGAKGIKHFASHCTACQLCVSVCPNGVLRPSGDIENMMQPESSYERGYCRPECTKCSEVCPAGAICKITPEEKSSIQIGHAVWIKENCVPLTDGVSCGNCARHCPTGAIQMVPSDKDNENSVKIPVINTEKCIGCGACENLCPARPFSAIYVEGHERHREI